MNLILRFKVLFLLFCLNCYTSKSVSNQGYSLEELGQIQVKSVSNFEQDISKAAANLLIIGEREIQNNLYYTLSDLLQDVPSIDIVDNAGRFGEFYTVRGIEGNDRFLVLIDGVKINPVSGSFLAIGNSISLKFAKRVEIVFGPSSLLHGTDAFSGVINIISKDYEEDFHFSFDASQGSFNTYHTDFLLGGKAGEQIKYQFSLNYHRSDGQNFIGRDSVYDAIKSYKPPFHNDFSQPINDLNIFAKTVISEKLNISYFLQMFSEGNSLGFNPDTYIYSSEAKWAFSNQFLSSNYSHDFNDRLKLVSELTYSFYLQDPNTKFLKWSNDSLDESFSQYMTGRSHSLRARSHLESSISENNLLSIGFDAEISSNIPPYANDEVLASPKKFSGINLKKIEDELTITDKRFAIWTELINSSFDFLELNIGGRLDFFSRFESSFNPRFALLFHPFAKTNIKLIYGTAFQVPSLFYQYEQWGSLTGVMLSESEIRKLMDSDWRLKSQKVESYDFYIDQKITDELSLDFSYYHQHLSGLIKRRNYFTPVYNKYFGDSVNFWQRNENIGSGKVVGITTSMKYTFSEDINFKFTYSYTKGTRADQGEEELIPRIAKDKFYISFAYNNIFNMLNLSLRNRTFGRLHNENSTDFPSGFQDGFNVLDISLILNLMEDKFSIYTKLMNVLDEDYRHGGLLEQSFYLSTIPQPGFNASFGMKLNF
jgi:outer membrane receptor for ferrienterochelin and colicin